jgi:steroid delta-isomerase-like uncharacterized protein
VSVTTERPTAAGAKETAAAFMTCLNNHDVEGAMALIDPAASFEIVPARIKGSAGDEGAAFVAEVLRAFPDLRITTRSVTGTPGTGVVEITMEGTQAGDFLGIDNQEKHIDVDQAWMFTADNGTITGVKAYWCQNQVYRRLGVKRLDQISISQPRKG